MWLNLYGRDAVQHKLKIGLKTPKMHFFTCFLALIKKAFVKLNLYIFYAKTRTIPHVGGKLNFLWHFYQHNGFRLLKAKLKISDDALD